MVLYLFSSDPFCMLIRRLQQENELALSLEMIPIHALKEMIFFFFGGGGMFFLLQHGNVVMRPRWDMTSNVALMVPGELAYVTLVEPAVNCIKPDLSLFSYLVDGISCSQPPIVSNCQHCLVPSMLKTHPKTTRNCSVRAGRIPLLQRK